MKCVAPFEISDEQLLAYNDGQADQATLNHIGRCPYCAQRARALVTYELTLRALFYRAECPDAHTLGEFHLGLLSAADNAAIEDHLRICTHCAAELVELEKFIQETPIAAGAGAFQYQLKRLVARLTPGSPGSETQQPALAFRGTAAAPLDVYQAEDIRMVVGLEADGLRAGRKVLLGFTTREGKSIESLSGARVQLNRRGETIATDQVDPLGNFAFFDLTSGEYQLVLLTNQEQVVIETIVI